MSEFLDFMSWNTFVVPLAVFVFCFFGGVQLGAQLAGGSCKYIR